MCLFQLVGFVLVDSVSAALLVVSCKAQVKSVQKHMDQEHDKCSKRVDWDGSCVH